MCTFARRPRQYFNELDTYQNNLTWQNSNQPRHRLTMAGTYELPFGKGRPYMTNMPKAAGRDRRRLEADRRLHLHDRPILRFGKMNYNGQDPTVSDPTPGKWFNTAASRRFAANTFVIRSNPLQFDNLTGPSYFMLDGTLSKTFQITENGSKPNSRRQLTTPSIA